MNRIDLHEPDDTPSRPTGARRTRRLPEVDHQRCTGCGRCVAACDLHLLSLEPVRWRKFAVLQEAPRCTGCSLCARICPFDAIHMRMPALGDTDGSDRTGRLPPA